LQSPSEALVRINEALQAFVTPVDINPKSQLRRLSDAAWRMDLRRRVRDRNFSVVSNNCWGAGIYSALGVEYRTPFVGLFLMPDCYLALLSDLRKRLSIDLTFLPESRYPIVNAMREDKKSLWPIGCLGEGVEIHFMHYADRDEAVAKWQRRVSRFAPDDRDVAVKLCDRDQLTDAQCKTFDALPFARKVLFTSTPAPGNSCAVRVHVPTPDGAALMYSCRSMFDVSGWLNGEGVRPSPGYLTRARLLGWR
jgi:uncharacterized protein (DUF1919 family)